MVNIQSRFNKVLNSDIAPLLADMEAKRKKYIILTWLLSGIWICITLTAVGVLYCYFKLEISINTLWVVASGIFLPFSPLPFILIYVLFDIKYTRKIKDKFANKLVCAFGDIKKIEAKEEVLTLEAIRKSGLFPIAEYRKDDDYFVGGCQNIPFFILETKFYFNNGYAPAQTFGGVILCIKTKKPFRGVNIIAPKTNLMSEVICWLIIAVILFATYKINDPKLTVRILPAVFIAIPFCIKQFIDFLKKKWKKIEFKDEKLNKAFSIKTSNIEETKNVISKEFFNQLRNLKKSFKAQAISASFFDNNVLVAISTRKNLFEMGNLSTTVYDIKSYKQFYKELSALISLVEYIVNSKHYKAFFDNK